ncbi:MAG TPA: hypothetical protein VGH03_16585 [Caulobacteraceae bacterium]|jgi:hypothetical protein
MGPRATALILAASATTLAGCSQPKAAASALTPRISLSGPSRRSGLWEQKVFRDGGRAHAVMRVCLGASSVNHPWLFAPNMGGDHCQRSITRGADGAYNFASICRLGPQAVVTSRGVARGDFTTSYEVQSVLTVTGAPLAEFDGRHALRVESRYRGACPPGLTPGDADLGQGITLSPKRLPQLASVFSGA